jgi:hypothetical protein
MSYATAERDYFDPRDPEPTCELCGGPQDGDEMSDDWNPDTGNHATCEAVERLTNPSDEEA